MTFLPHVCSPGADDRGRRPPGAGCGALPSSPLRQALRRPETETVDQHRPGWLKTQSFLHLGKLAQFA
ncbi:MAG: hypothetical protein RL201_748 [Actinomycetota bacterium]